MFWFVLTGLGSLMVAVIWFQVKEL